MPTGSRAEIEQKLTPAPSMSRTGKMTHSAMHTDALVRGGVAALQNKVRKKGKNSITLAEIIDPSQLDSFGTALPGTDAGRNKELCSSPRGHPELQNKLEEILVRERTTHFNTKMELREAESFAGPSVPTATPPKQKRFAPAPTVRQTRTVKGKGKQSSACFLTVDRFMDSKYAMNTPPVGHYRPKFSAVDGNTKAMVMRPASQQVPLHSDTDDGAEAVTTCPRLARVEQVEAAKDNVKSDERKQAEPVPPQSPAEDERSPQRCLGYAEWVSRRRAGVSQKGSSAFVSGVKNAANRPTPLPVSPDKFYYPYNEMGVMPKKEVPTMSLSWGSHTSRKDKIMFKGYSPHTDAPDVVYDSVDKPTVHVSASYRMTDQLARDKAAADAQQMVSRRNNCINAAAAGDTQKFPASHIVYETDHAETVKFKNNGNLNDFSRTISRDQRPTEVQKPKKPLDPVTPYDTTSPPKTLESRATFQNQLTRPEFLCQVPLDLEYNTKNPMSKRSHTADIDRTGGHEGLFVPSITMDCDYNPNYAAARPNAQIDVRLDKMLSRDEVRAGHATTKPSPLDTFYSTDPGMTMRVSGAVVKVPLKGPRIQGNPMIHSHISRDKRQQTTAVKNCSPDKYYNLPSGPKVPTIDFKRTVAREDRSCGRLLPASPRQESSHQRSPGFVYDPRTVDRHIPALSFSRAGFA